MSDEAEVREEWVTLVGQTGVRLSDENKKLLVDALSKSIYSLTTLKRIALGNTKQVKTALKNIISEIEFNKNKQENETTVNELVAIMTNEIVLLSKTPVNELDAANDIFLADQQHKIKTLKEMRVLIEPSEIVTAYGFKDAILKNQLVVDRSMLIDKLIDYKKVIVTFPRRWGKTLNMEMVQAFFEIELDLLGKPLPERLCLNGHLFETGGFDQNGQRRPMKIMEHKDLVDKYLGKYIVVKLTLNLSGASCADIVENLAAVILDIFTRFECIVPHINSKTDQERFKSHLDKANLLNRGFLKTSLHFLCKVLNQHYQKKIVLLVDEYDYTSNYIFRNFSDSDRDAHQLAELIRDMLGLVVKDKDYLELAMFTGVLNLAKDGAISSSNQLKEFTLINSTFSEFYGFNDSDVDCLFQVLGLDTKYRADVRKMYMGYRFNSDSSVYNPWSVANCLNNCMKNTKLEPKGFSNDVLRSYWTSSSSIEFVKPLMIQPAVMVKLGEILSSSKRETEFTFHQQISKEQMNNLKRVIDKCNSQPNKYVQLSTEHVNILFSYLTFQGYFSIKSCSSSSCVVTFPNLEVEREILNMLASKIDSPSIIEYAACI